MSLTQDDNEPDSPDAIVQKPTRLSYSFARQHGLIILEHGDRPVIGRRQGEASKVNEAKETSDPWALIEVCRRLGAAPEIEDLPPQIFDRRLSEIYAADGISSQALESHEEGDLSSLAEGLPVTADLLASEDDAPVIRLINALIAEAVKTRASDIHVEPYENNLSVRLRIDGQLREVLSLSARLTPMITSRIKVMARLDIAEKRVPQDGRISLALGGKSVDVRVSTLPSRFGERVVMRLLDKDQVQLDLEKLGMPAPILKRFEHLLVRPNGIILVTGPTGSGKTTTLYAAMSLLNKPDLNILTIEDPVEYAIEGIGQTQVNTKVGMTFAKGLRAILRQDPNIVMVGEIRDVETADIAVQASLAGRLVLSTVHTNSAVGTITRLRDMGVEPYLLSSTIAGVMSQRLVRRLCGACAKQTNADEAARQLMKIPDGEEMTLYEPVGCARCNHTGYEGRLGIYELLVVDETFRQLVHDDAGEAALTSHAFADAPTLLQSGFEQVRAGKTSLEEVLRVVREDGEA